MLITPQYLKKGDAIGIVAPARKVLPSEIEYSLRIFESWGLKIKTGKHLYGACNQYSGSDTDRKDDFNSMINDPEVKAIICARGGYGTVRIIDDLDFRTFTDNPKWIVGYSDITVLHSHINSNCKIETLHATMPLNFSDAPGSKASVESLRKALFGEHLGYVGESHRFNRPGKASGTITGGNLSILYALSATASGIDTKGKFLFIEDLDEYLYHIDRMMLNLKRSGKLEHLAGLIVGGMSDMKDNEIPFGHDAEEIVFSAVKEYEYPVCFGFPAGHVQLNMAIIMGRFANLEVDEGFKLTYKY